MPSLNLSAHRPSRAGGIPREREHRHLSDGPQAALEGVFLRIVEDGVYFRVAVETLLDAGDTVVALGRYEARHKTTGKDLNAQMAHIWWLRDGNIIRFQQYADTAQARAASGLG